MDERHPMRRWREDEIKLTQGELGDLVKVSGSHISMIEARIKDPSLDLMERIVAVANGALTLASFAKPTEAIRSEPAQATP